MTRFQSPLYALVANLLVWHCLQPAGGQGPSLTASYALWNDDASQAALESQQVAPLRFWNVPHLKFTLGPAVVPPSTALTLGLFTQTLFSERTQLTQLQPMLADSLGAGWSVDAGDLQFTVDWAKSRSNVPLGVQLGVVCPVFEQPIRFFVSPQYNLKDVPGTDRFKVMVGFALLAPESDTTKR